MGVKVFRNDNWNRIRNGVISRKDLMGLDKDQDKELIAYLIAHVPETGFESILKYVGEEYGINEMPEPLINIDDPDDTFFWEYAVLNEQVKRESDREVLKEAALHSSDSNIATFAFCRLTGHSFRPDPCDALSYRTYDCGILPDSDPDDINEFCQMMIKERGLFADVANKYLSGEKTVHQ